MRDATSESTVGAGATSRGGASLVRAAALAVVAATSLRKIGTYDIWWHLAYGRWMLEHRAVPRVDTFSFTAAGAERVDGEWLFQLAAALLWRLAGPAALVLAKTALMLVVAWLALRFVERELAIGPLGAAAFTLPFLLAGAWRFVERPELVTLALLALVVDALYRRRERPPSLRRLAWIPVLFALWANAHAGLIVGAGVLALYAAGRALGGDDGTLGRPTARQAATLLALSLAASLANPFGWRVWQVPFALTALHEAKVFRNVEWAAPRWPASWLLFVALAIAMGAVATRRQRPDWAALLPLAAITALGLRYVRNASLFGSIAPMLVAAALAGPPRGAVATTLGRLERRLRPSLAVASLLALAAALAFAARPMPIGLSVDATRLPVAAVDFLERESPPGRVLNNHPWGGYLLWRLGPERPVFIDGRDDIYADLRRRLAVAVTDSREWRRLLDEYRIGHTLAGYDARSFEVREVDAEGRLLEVVRQPWAVTYFPPEQWALVYFDDLAMIHVRRTPEAEALIAREGLANLFPEDTDYQLRQIARGEVSPLEALRELDRVLARNPGCRRALRLRRAIESAAGG